MKIITTYKDTDDAPITGLTPLITITDITNMTSPVAAITTAPMIEIGSGFYGYIFTTYQEGKEYTVFIDADDSIQGRYQYGTLDKIDVPEALSDIENNLDIRKALRLILSVLAGRSAGGGTNLVSFKNISGSKNRITATVDELGNRLNVNLDAE